MVTVAVTVVTILVNALAAAADLVGARFVLANSGEVGIDRKWVLPLGLLKAAGAMGLLLGLLGVPLVGPAAAGGLVLFLAGALLVHVRARVFHNIAVPGFFFVAAVATLVLAVGS